MMKGFMLLQESARNGIPIVVSNDVSKLDVLSRARELGVSVEVYTVSELRKKYTNG